MPGIIYRCTRAVKRIFRKGWLDSLDEPGYLRNFVRTELSQAIGRFSNGFFNSPAIVSDTLTITGVIKSGRGRLRYSPILVPVATASKFASGGLSNDPTELYAALTSGGRLLRDDGSSYRDYPRITLQLDRHIPFQTVKDSVEAHGFRTFSYAEEFEEISRFFLYFGLALALIELIALTTASLGIVNTMVMSIMERRREIGVLKSLGASERDIKVLYLFESALIGAIGAVAGILLGWLVAIAFAFGLLVIVVAGAYPAARAAKVDPMEAPRAE